MILTGVLSLLLLSSAPASDPAAVTGSQTTEAVQTSCLAAVSGDEAAEEACLKPILEQAEPMRVDELDPKFSSSCLVIPEASRGDLIWAYLEWLGEHPDAGPKPASMTINTALLEKIPCGWREQ